ncbi:hypothetical protein ACJX0J_014707, partial [Zea mays]
SIYGWMDGWMGGVGELLDCDGLAGPKSQQDTIISVLVTIFTLLRVYMLTVHKILFENKVSIEAAVIALPRWKQIMCNYFQVTWIQIISMEYVNQMQFLLVNSDTHIWHSRF